VRLLGGPVLAGRGSAVSDPNAACGQTGDIYAGAAAFFFARWLAISRSVATPAPKVTTSQIQTGDSKVEPENVEVTRSGVLENGHQRDDPDDAGDEPLLGGTSRFVRRLRRLRWLR
jgi:hypothetical protein